MNTALDLLVGWDDPSGVASLRRRSSPTAATTLTVAAFRRRARHLKGTLHPEPAETLHARAFTTRRVDLEPVEDGMAWIHLLVSAPDAIRILARLTGTARTIQKSTTRSDPDWRTRSQIRADLAAGWLAGDDTPTAAQVRPILLVPMLSLLGEGSEPSVLRGYGPIDRASAARLLTAAPAFRRVLTDPSSGEKLVYDRTRYRADQGAARLGRDPVRGLHRPHLHQTRRRHRPRPPRRMGPRPRPHQQRQPLPAVRHRQQTQEPQPHPLPPPTRRQSAHHHPHRLRNHHRDRTLLAASSIPSRFERALRAVLNEHSPKPAR